jgi:GTP-binding protein Era
MTPNDDTSDNMSATPAGTGVHRSGYVALAGRPNVGKSTLVNALVEQKVSIVTAKPQTTRHRILGIVTRPDAQIVLIDTPGLHSNARRALNQHMNRTAVSAVAEADLTLFIVAAGQWLNEDQAALDRVQRMQRPILAVVNKIDRISPTERLLPFIGELARRANFVDIVPVSALRRANLDRLLERIKAHLPVAGAIYPAEQITDRSQRFLIAEIIREKLTLALSAELPYGLSVEIEAFEETADGCVNIAAVIWVEREGQKAIVIGENGERLKHIGRAARLEVKAMLGKPVYLELWVKVKENWADDARALRSLGYEST